MFYKKQKKNYRIYYFLLIFIVLLLIFRKEVEYTSKNINLIFYPIKSFIYSKTLYIKSNFNNILAINKIIKENSKLTEENYILKIENESLRELKAENERLKELLEIKKNNPFKFKIAKVIFRDSLTLYDSVYINLGSNDGIVKNMVVLNKTMLLGKVTEVYKESSKVDLITKKDYYVSVFTENENNLGILRGLGGTILKLENIIFEKDIKVGDVLKTSGISEIYPKNITVGKIKSIKNTKSGKDIEVELPYNILYLNELIVMF